jgi:UDP-N-acetyl-D-mannosaminuronate dehydrogenase
MKIGILGYGEVGKAISQFYPEHLVATKKGNNFEKGMGIIHICLPYNSSFNKTVIKIFEKFRPIYGIIHSTVPVGTTEYLSKRVEAELVHSPIRGVHPNLYEGIKTFVKYIGTDDINVGARVGKHFKSIGIESEIVMGSKHTEMGKLIDTTYYGLCIAFHDYVDKLCEKEKLRFDDVMTNFNKTYNNGYTILNMENVVRPVLYPPKGKIGGHCIIPNVKLLKKQFGKNSILKSILKVK